MDSLFNRDVWPQVHDWAVVPFASAEVYRVTLADATTAYLRPDDGSALLLPELVARGVLTPSALVKREGGGCCSPKCRHTGVRCQVACPPRLPHAAPRRCVAGPGVGEVSHGDLTLPNVLGDLATEPSPAVWAMVTRLPFSPGWSRATSADDLPASIAGAAVPGTHPLRSTCRSQRVVATGPVSHCRT
jgi:hypothetical protein